MNISSYPHGFAGGVSIRGIPVLNTYSGNALWVDSNGSQSGNGTFRRPYATLQAALSAASANDIIMVKAGHSETITGVGGLTAATAGVQVIGLGYGTKRPRFLMDGGATVDFAVSAADVTVQNCVFASGHADVVRCFNVTAKGFRCIECEFNNNVVDENFLTPIKATSTVDNNADYLTVVGCKFQTVDAATLEFIEINANVVGLTVQNNVVIHEGTASPLILVATGKIFTGAMITGNFLSHKQTANELLVNNDGSTNSGIIAHNRVGHADTTTTHDLGIDGLGCRLFDNLSTSTGSVSGVVLPAIDVDN